MRLSTERQISDPYSGNLPSISVRAGRSQSSLPSLQSADLDLTLFFSLRELFDERLLSDTYRTFLAETRERLRGLLGLSEEKAFREIGHTLRGSAGMLGASRVAVFATLLEHLSPGSEGMADALAALTVACDALEIALRGQGVQL